MQAPREHARQGQTYRRLTAGSITSNTQQVRLELQASYLATMLFNRWSYQTKQVEGIYIGSQRAHMAGIDLQKTYGRKYYIKYPAGKARASSCATLGVDYKWSYQTKHIEGIYISFQKANCKDKLIEDLRQEVLH